MGLFIRLFICIFAVGLTLYKAIDNLNDLTELQLAIPTLAKEVQEIKEKNLELEFEIERFESPVHLMEIARQPEFGHLKYQTINDVIILNRTITVEMDELCEK